MRRRLALVCAALLLWPALAAAEVDTIKIPRGAGGVGFLPLEVLNDPDIRYTTSPENVMKYADFMAGVRSEERRDR